MSDTFRPLTQCHKKYFNRNVFATVPMQQLSRNNLGKHLTHVFSYKGKPVKKCNNHAWRKALQRANITNFRWHDLRHTWASWHVQSGTSLHELQILGGWSNYETVLRYAHLSSRHLQEAAERIYVTKMTHANLEEKRR